MIARRTLNNYNFFQGLALKFINNNLIKICWAIVGLSLLAALFYPLWFPQSSVCSQNYANFGQWISGIVSVVGIPFIILTLYLQTRTIEEDEREKTFERHCKSIEIGLSYIRNRNNNVEGGAALVRYGELCEAGTLDFIKATDELTVDALKSVTAALSDLLEWVRQPKNRFQFHSFFRVRFMSLIIAFEKMLPPDAHGMTEAELFRRFGNDNHRYPLILSIHRLKAKEFDVWTEYEEAKELTVPRG